MVIPVPPLSEQCRIVARVEALMALCDSLEEQISAAQAEGSRFLDAVLRQTLNDVAGERIAASVWQSEPSIPCD
jgi:type I restriction enzyme S subunit